jgi:hypothetical protein
LKGIAGDVVVVLERCESAGFGERKKVMILIFFNLHAGFTTNL